MKRLTGGAAVAALICTPVWAQSEAAGDMQDETVAAVQAADGQDDAAITADADPATQAVDGAVDAAGEAMASDVDLPLPPAPPPPPPPPPEPLLLSSGVPIKLVVTQEVNSSTHDAGDIFDLTVMDDVTVNDTVVIRKGTPAKAEITWRTGKGAFGKSGKLEFALRSIDLEQGRLPVTGEFRQEGEGNTVATGVGVLAVGVFAGFITGKRARLPQGRELLAQTATDVMFTPAGLLDPEFDSDKAMFEATADDPLTICKLEAEQIEKEKKRAKAVKKCYKKRLE